MKTKEYGYHLVMDLYGCDSGTISSRDKLKEFVDKLCKIIKMKQFGETMIPYFGENKPHTKGYSLMQFIETSSIVGHFSELFRSAYIDLFSCMTFDADKAKEFTKKFFGAKKIKARLLIRK